ncbi:MAG: hypothetical protein Q4C43_08245 [Prevotella sp.]|nr:hypothetical protein [Prevotella sp.]MDO4933966.1 hypothetical protein [Prevotella sp.]
MTVVFAGCTNQGLIDGEADVRETEPVKTVARGASEMEKEEMAALVDRARWGDAQAYLQLADRYRQGVGGNKDFLGVMYMSSLAAEHRGIKNRKEYIANLRNGEFKTYIDILDTNSDDWKEKNDSILSVLNAMEGADATALAGVVTIAGGDTLAGMELIDKSAGQGSTMARMAKMFKFAKGKEKPDVDSLLRMAEETPLLYLILVEEYRYKDDEESKRIAANCCKEAEKHAMLRVSDARWLLGYYRDGGDVQLTAEDVKRLEAFVLSYSENKDAVATDPDCGCDTVEVAR